ncbi:MAG: phytanoyl-CoA dioxygenase family protein [Deltaproteobacteria bacterium]|nr:phytanoyl-CoA dioxygenase family protein [Deltaproteobacteria bacterium]
MNGFDLDAHAAAIERDGYTTVYDFLTPEDLAEVRRVLGLYLGRRRGRNNFEGYATERLYTLVARARVFWRLALDPRIESLCQRFLLPGYLLTASQAIRLGPEETPQPFHADDLFYTVPRPRPMISLSTIVAVDAFTADNGGTEVVPGSHRWSDEEVAHLAGQLHADAPEGQHALESQCVPVVMPAGACVVFAGTLVHRGGANRTGAPRCAFSHQYCQPWARQQENFTLAVPVEVAREMPPALQALLGYSIHPPFMGQLTASHPLKALDPAYENRIIAQAREVGARLPE